MWKGALAVVLLAVSALYVRKSLVTLSRTHGSISSDGQNASYQVFRNIWSQEDADHLLRMVEQKGTYTTVVDDSTSQLEHIGEAQPITPEGTCLHPYLVPNKNRTLCVLPSRIDVGRHYLMTGGQNAHKEGYSKLVSRIMPFSGFIFDKLDAPQFRPLFHSERYKQGAAEICEGKTLLDPIQLGIIISLPGQAVAAHFDVPWFYGATRFQLPQWLTIVMEQSKLWKDIRVPQVQGVAYLHRWRSGVDDVETQSEVMHEGGNFFFYPEGTDGIMKSIPPQFNTGICLDGSIVVHGADTFCPESSPPLMKKDEKNSLQFIGDGKWKVLSGNGTKLGEYSSDDLRITLVWRARCFEGEEDLKRWKNTQPLSAEEILDTLVEDLKKRGRIETRPEPLELAMILLDEYVNMPLPDALIPYNYCMLEKFLPNWMLPALDMIC